MAIPDILRLVQGSPYQVDVQAGMTKIILNSDGRL